MGLELLKVGRLEGVQALGGAKNHLVALPDCEPESASQDIVASFAGCCGQRCMAASVLVAVGEVDHILDAVAKRAKAIRPGIDLGPVTTAAAPPIIAA